MTLTVGSLFAGIGGFDLGLERAGMEIRWQIEIDDYCRRVLAKHWPDVPKYGDIHDIKAEDIERVDVLAGGFPCQSVSQAGKRLGQADPRWLWPEFARLIREIRPRWVLAENVPALRSANNGRLFGGILADLAACGYDAEWDCIPAATIGAPHIRDRIWIVAHAKEQPIGAGLCQGETSTFGWRRLGDSSCTVIVSDTDGDTEGWLAESRRECGFWATEPNVGRVAHGIPRRVDRLRGLGNAVVPQVVEHIGRRIVEVSS